jgi:hypothetical protein
MLVKVVCNRPQPDLRWQQNPAVARSWQDQDYPKIAARAKKENTLISFTEEPGVRSEQATERSMNDGLQIILGLNGLMIPL